MNRWLLSLLVILGAIFGVAAAGNGEHNPAYRLPPGTDTAPVRLPPPGWRLEAKATVPQAYYQGITSDPAGQLYFDGPFYGLYRTDAQLHEVARNPDAIPLTVRSVEGYNHIGDITWDAAEGGRLLLPLECFYPALGKGEAANTCKTGAIGVADPRTLQWRYYVKLDHSIDRAPWGEVSPDGKLLWTAAGHHLLAFRTADINPANAGPDGPAISPARRLTVEDQALGGITGATFFHGRLLVASMEPKEHLFTVASIDVSDGSARTVLARHIVGESEGLDVDKTAPDTLRWQITPFTPQHARPTYGSGHVTVLSFEFACATQRHGTAGADRLTGSSEGDRIDGYAGDDVIVGGPGADCLSGGLGHDRIYGGPGSDTIDAVDGERDIVDCGPGRDTVFEDRNDKVTGCERVHRM